MTDVQTRPPAAESRGALDRYFDITGRGSTVAREMRGGLTTFVAMVYLVLLIPIILGGVPDVAHKTLPSASLTTMVALSAAVTTFLMGVVGRAPLAMAAGLGVTPIVAFQAAPHMTWPEAMGLVFLEGVVIVILAVTGIRQLIMDAIPLALKHAVGVGIGMFIALIGLVDAGFVRPGTGTPITMGNGGHLDGWPTIVFCFGLLLTFVLFARRVPGAILIGIAASTVLAIILNSVVKIPDKAWGSIVPKTPHSVASAPHFGLLGHVSVFGGFGRAGAITAIVVLFTLVLSGFFDAMGTIMGVTEEAGLVDEDGRLPGIGRMLTVDGLGAVVGGLTSGSANTAVVESATGVGEGARTGLASVVTGLLLAATLFLTPLAGVVPSQAAAPALVLVGALMMTSARKITWEEPEIYVPAFLTIALMPFTYSITNGVGAGVISYAVMMAARGRWRDVHWLLYLIAAIFVVYFAIHPVETWLGVH
jgi:adenine/guanine/hypoxanthine permease